MFKSEKKTSFRKYISVSILILSIFVLSAGCEKKAEKPEGTTNSKDTTNMGTSEQTGPDSTTMADTTKQYPDLTGTWTGSFESHGASLKVTNQNNESFKASLSVAYREPMNKTISGTIDLSTNKLTMKDDVKSRNEATYTATLSEDGMKITGISTLKIDGNKANFTFKKK
jgi:hypothetical protein